MRLDEDYIPISSRAVPDRKEIKITTRNEKSEEIDPSLPQPLSAGNSTVLLGASRNSAGANQNQPEDLTSFVAALKRAYSNAYRPTGYARVADLRDRVCFELRLPDFGFDELLKRCVKASQHDKLPLRTYLDSSLSQPVTVLKRAPLEFGEGTFNLIRIDLMH